MIYYHNPRCSKSREGLKLIEKSKKKVEIKLYLSENVTNAELINVIKKLEVKPITGRTHQIRVHCANAGHPIVGDVKYAKIKLSHSKKLHLHAKKLIFNDNNEKVCVKSNRNLSLKNYI